MHTKKQQQKDMGIKWKQEVSLLVVMEKQ